MPVRSCYNGDLVLAYHAGALDSDEWFWPMFHSAGRMNFWTYANPAVDTLLEQGRFELDAQFRKLRYNSAERLIVDDAPAIFLLRSRHIVCRNPAVAGYVAEQDGSARSLVGAGGV